MAYLNYVALIGNLTRDPETRYTPKGTAICEFSIAINRKYKLADGQEREETAFLDVCNMGRCAEGLSRYMGKGTPVLVTGSIRMEQWQDRQSGVKRSKISILADRVQLLERPPIPEPQERPQPSARPEPEHRFTESDKNPPGIGDDIPF